MARPTKYTKKLLNKARDYLYNCPDTVPSITGLCVHIGIANDTAHAWRAEGKEEFSDILKAVMQEQELKLVSGGLSGLYNATITKMMLTKHGYSDKTETDITTNGQSINTWTVNPVTSDTSK